MDLLLVSTLDTQLLPSRAHAVPELQRLPARHDMRQRGLHTGQASAAATAAAGAFGDECRAGQPAAATGRGRRIWSVQVVLGVWFHVRPGQGLANQKADTKNL